ncbi:MAG: WD40 repeat domain-containing protein, partial [Planctomycetes bacterium]|nr:WD40 repeat domain-containing protein [Planctomycetota bacterium]
AVFSRDATRLVAQDAGSPATLRVLDTATGAELAACPAPCDAKVGIHADRDVTRVAWVQARGKNAAPTDPAAADPDKNVRFLWLWDVARNEARPIERRPAGMLDDDRIEIAVGTRWLAYGTPFGRSIAVDVDALFASSPDGDDWERHRFRRSQVAPRVACADLSPDGLVLALGTSSKRIVLRSIVDDGLLGQLVQHTGTVTAVAFRDDGATLWSGATDQTLREWDVRSQLQRHVWFGHEGAVDDVMPAADGRILSRSDDGSLRVWSAREDLAVLRGHDGEQPYVYAIAFSPDGKRMASGGWDHRVCEWDVASGRPIQVFGDADAQRMPAVSDLAYATDGRTIVVAGAKSLHVCDVATGDVRRVVLDSQASCERVAPAAIDGAWYVVPNSGRSRSGEARGVSQVELASGATQLGFTLDGTRPTCVATSANGAWVATGSADGRVALWRARDGGLVRTWAEHALPVDSIEFARDGRRLVSAAGDATARVYDVDGDRVVVMAEHTARVFSATFSADGRRVATGCEDSVVRLFDADSGALVLELRGHDDYVHDVAFSPDGAVLASGSGDGTVRLWDTRPLRDRYLAWRTADARK